MVAILAQPVTCVQGIIPIIYLVLIGARDIGVSAWTATVAPIDNVAWRTRFGEMGSQRLGFAILKVLGGVAAFIAFNAGLSIAGL